MNHAIIKANNRCFQASKALVIPFVRGLVSRADAVKYLNVNFREGSFKHWDDLLHALMLDVSETALLTFDEAAFIGRELKLTENGRVIESLPVIDFKPVKRRAGRPPKKAA